LPASKKTKASGLKAHIALHSRHERSKPSAESHKRISLWLELCCLSIKRKFSTGALQKSTGVPGQTVRAHGLNCRASAKSGDY
jgi:hypothetical protein